jgi:hypothetical protein
MDEADEIGSIMSIRSEGVQIQMPGDFLYNHTASKQSVQRKSSTIMKLRSNFLSE